LFYGNRAEQMATIIPFLKDGLTRGERCIHIADEQSVEEVAQSLRAAAVDVRRQQKRGALLLLTKRETYLRSGKFDPRDMIASLRQMQEQALADGFAGIRGTGEMTWALGSEVGCDRLIEYEALLNSFFPGSSFLAICQYNFRRFSAAVVRGVLRTHPKCVLGGPVHDNLYYEPPKAVWDRDLKLN